MRGVTLSSEELVLDFATVESRDMLAMWFDLWYYLSQFYFMIQSSIFNKPYKHYRIFGLLQPTLGYYDK